MMTVRAGPNRSVTTGPICHTQYMFIATCSSPACSQPALNTVHHRPRVNTGTEPLAPNRIRISLLGDSADMIFPVRMLPPDINSVTTQSETQAPTTIGPNPKSAPRRRMDGPKPHNPGCERPQV